MRSHFTGSLTQSKIKTKLALNVDIMSALYEKLLFRAFFFLSSGSPKAFQDLHL